MVLSNKLQLSENMKKEITIYTHDPIYAYNFRNKFANTDWSVQYLNSVDSLRDYTRINKYGAVFIGGNDEVLDGINNYIQTMFTDFLFIYINNENVDGYEYYANSNIIRANLDKIDIVMNDVSDFLKKKSIIYDRQDNAKIFNSITEALSSFGLSPKRIGYKYLQECLEHCLNLGKGFICFKSDIYPVIAKNYNVSMSAVEKSIRSSLQEAFRKFPELFNYECFKFGHPTNNQFINFILERIK